MQDTEPTIWASMGTTVNTGNFENIKIDIGVSGIPVNCTDEYLAHRLAEANMTLEKVVESLAEKLADKVEEYKKAAGISR